MKLGGRTRNMFTEPFEETEPEYALYGEFKRQIGHAINTKTESNIFRPDPHNKEIGKTRTEKEITQRVERIDDQGTQTITKTQPQMRTSKTTKICSEPKPKKHTQTQTHVNYTYPP